MLKQTRQVMPPARKANLVVRKVGNEVLVYDLLDHTSHCLSAEAAAVWQHCDGRTTIAETARLIGVQASQDLVRTALHELQDIHLIVEETMGPETIPNLSRRTAMRRIAVGTAIATLPLVTSILVPTPAQALSCFGHGHPCSSNAQCCTGLCAGGVVCA